MLTDLIASMVEGRIRLRSPHFKDAELARRFAELAVNVPGMLEVTVNPLAGSALLLYNPEELPTQVLLERGKTLAALLPPEPKKRRAGRAPKSPVSTFLAGKKGRAAVTGGIAASFLATLATGYVYKRGHPGLGWLLAAFTLLHCVQTWKR